MTGLLPSLVLALSLVAALPGQRGGAAEVLSNQDVIGMTSAKLSKDLLIAKINTTRNTFDVSVQGLIALHQGKVHQDVMRSMLNLAADPKLGTPSKKAEVLDNQSVVSLITAKVPKAVILAKIQSTKSAFDVSSSGLVSLTQAKVPQDVIRAMVAKSSGGL